MKAWLLFALALGTAACEKLVTYEPPPEKRAMDGEKQAMADAKALATKGDLEGAHGKLSQISVDSPIRATVEFHEIEDHWAQGQIAKADAEKDKTKKLALLEDVAKASAVIPEIRGSASNKIALATPDPAIPQMLANYDEAVASANIAACKELLIKHDMKGTRDLLLPRVFAGIASPEERDMLLATCAFIKDKGCIGRLEDAGLVGAGMSDKMMSQDALPITSGACASCPMPKPKPKPKP